MRSLLALAFVAVAAAVGFGGERITPTVVTSHPAEPAGAWPPSVWADVASGSALPRAVNDSAREELRIGRAWHAARLLRAAGAANGSSSDVLLLASAESGWKNHAAVPPLLADAAWLARESGGQGLAYLGMAHEDAGRWADAAAAYAAYLASESGSRDVLAAAAEGRLARSLARAGDTTESLAVLTAMDGAAAVVGSWVAVELAREGVAAGDTARVAAFLSRVTDEEARRAVWRDAADARLAAGDHAGALADFQALRSANEGVRGAQAGVEVGGLLLAAGDTTAAVQVMRESLEEAPPALAGRAARVVLDQGDPDAGESLRLARALDRAGDGGRALRAFDRAARLMGASEALPENDRLSRARIMATVAARQDEAVEEFRAITDTLAGTSDARIGARTLEVWAGLRQRQGQSGNVATLRRWLIERYPDSPEAAELMWSGAWNAETGGATDALSRYEALAAAAGAQARAGQARMRIGQIHLARGRLDDAAGAFESYLEDFPNGRRWDEAAFWTARTRLELGDTVAAMRQVVRLRREEPFSYYAVMAADLVVEPYRMVALAEAEPVVEPGWLTEGFRRLDLLTAADLPSGADAEEARLVATARGSTQETLRLAEGLIERGRTITGINLGWALRAGGAAWDERLVRVVYPFPFRELVYREAAEWGVDPMVMAALIRQESAFKEDIVSRAGAVGLMQVMPPTGRELARAHGPAGFQDAALTTAEVNLHLGAAFFRDMSRRYGDLPLVLSAYNAGPTRATRWRNYPEASDWLRFTERVPFDETRGYIKNVRRNIGVYRILYGPLS